MLRLTRVAAAATCALAAGLLSGCNVATPPPVHTVTPTASSVTSEPAATSPTATPAGAGASEPTPLTSAAGGTPTPCDGADLSASGDFGAGAGNDGFLITLTNHSASPCILSGYLNLVDTAPAGPALHVTHGSSMLYTDPGPHTVVVASGTNADFGIGYAEAGGCAEGGAQFHALNIVFASDVLTLPIGTWRMGDPPGVEEICDGDVQETAVSRSSVQG
jgi:hypothetical protein